MTIREDPASIGADGTGPARIFAVAVARHRAGALAQAAVLYEQTLALRPDHADALHLLGLTHAQRGDTAAALPLIRQAIDLRPDLAQPYYNLGNALRALGEAEDAIEAYRAALALDPGLIAAWGNLGAVLRALGRGHEAIEACREAVARHGSDAGTHYNLGCALHHDLRIEEAALAYRHALALDPGHTDAATNLGTALLKLGRAAEALEYLRRAARHAPGSPDVQIALSAALLTLGAAPAAMEAARRATALAADAPASWAQLARALRDAGKSGAAVDASRRALALAPGDGELRIALAVSLQEHGDIVAARTAAREAVAAQPGSASAWTLLAGLETFAFGDPRTAELAALAKRLANQPGHLDEAIHAGFALGKARMDAGEVDLAFAALSDANRRHREQIDYDVADDLTVLKAIAAAFGPERIAAMSNTGLPDARPIFVVGMPRSGTTLVEQILAAHPLVAAGGEMKHLDVALFEHFGTAPATGEWASRLSTLDVNSMRAIGVAYLRRVATIIKPPSGGRFTDKMPSNFRHAGLIHLLFPNAVIVDCRRSMLDTCLSCFATHFAQGQPFTYDLAELGAYYRGYEALMAHWRGLLPEERLVTVRYEDVVADLEREARRLISACGLPWDDACLAFHRTTRPVRTASVSQVRQPLYDTSVERAQPYTHLLRRLGAV